MSTNVERSDLEKKLREIQDEVDDAATTAKPAALSIGTAIIAGAVGIAYIIGQRKGDKRTTIVEVRRV